MPDDHEGMTGFTRLFDDFEVGFEGISHDGRCTIVEVIDVFDIHDRELPSEAFCSRSRSLRGTRDDTIRLESDETEIVRHDFIRLFSGWDQGSIIITPLPQGNIYRLRMAYEYNLFFLRISEHKAIISKNTPIQVGVFFYLLYFDSLFTV